MQENHNPGIILSLEKHIILHMWITVSFALFAKYLRLHVQYCQSNMRSYKINPFRH